MAFKNALHTALWGAAAAPFPGHLDQHPIAVPGVVELVVADVDVLAAVFPQGKAKTLAAAAQPGRNQLGILEPGNARFLQGDQAKLAEALQADLELQLLSLLAQPQGFFQLWQRQGFIGWKLVEQVGDRELHWSECWLAGPPQEFPGYGAVVDGDAADRTG